jgi:hypothetical protein
MGATGSIATPRLRNGPAVFWAPYSDTLNKLDPRVVSSVETRHVCKDIPYG